MANEFRSKSAKTKRKPGPKPRAKAKRKNEALSVDPAGFASCPHMKHGWCEMCVVAHVRSANDRAAQLVWQADFERHRWMRAASDYTEERNRRHQIDQQLGLFAAKVRAVAMLGVRRNLSVPGGHIIYLAQRSAQMPTFPGRWECSGGKIEPNESPVEAAVRELKEETGFELPPTALDPCGLIRVRSPNRAESAVVHLYLFDWWALERPRDTEPTMRGPWRELELDDPPSNMTPATESLISIARAFYQPR